MNRIKALFCLFTLLVMISQASASLLDANLCYVSNYMWRGYDLNGNQPALQPSLTVYLGSTGLNLNLWGSINAGNAARQELTEVDYTLTYSGAWPGRFNYSIYYVYYVYPNRPGIETGEIFTTLCFNELFWSPTLLFSYDMDKGKNAYVNLAGKSNLTLGALELSPAINAGYDMGQFGVKAGWSDINLSLSTILGAGTFSITPSINYVMANPENRIADSPNKFWASLGIGASL